MVFFSLFLDIKLLVRRKRSTGLSSKVQYLQISIFFLFFFQKISWTSCSACKQCIFSFVDTILSLFKSQEEAFGQAVQKFNLRGNQHGRIYHYGECNVATVLKNYKRTGIHSSISMHILHIPCEIKEENLSNNQDLQLVIISFILLTSCLIQRWSCKEKLYVSHSHGL